jgi:hypothetical protein
MQYEMKFVYTLGLTALINEKKLSSIARMWRKQATNKVLV